MAVCSYLQIEAPVKTGTLYHNYKGFFSVVLFVISLDKYDFTVVHVAQHDFINYIGVLTFSKVGYAIEKTLSTCYTTKK